MPTSSLSLTAGSVNLVIVIVGTTGGDGLVAIVYAVVVVCALCVVAVVYTRDWDGHRERQQC